MMTSRTLFALLAGQLAWIPAGASAQDAALGKTEYEANCAVCHGVSGKGDGPFAAFIKTAIPDLTVLAKNNGGTFPSDRINEIVDGRAEVAVHGSRDMPIWGLEYNDQAVEYYREVWSIQDPASFVRARIGALVAYIETLQQ
jgi:mono/diheme cytochrome c family protein